jgi:deoxyribodipyrimidine photo-lyase
MVPRVIHWFRRDLRVTDNPALNAAVAAGGEVLPVYVLSGWREQHRWTGPIRQEFLCGCVRSLDANLRALGGRLIVRQGRADEELGRLIRETGATAVCFNRDLDPFGKAMEERVTRVARELGAEARGFADHVLHGAAEVRTGEGGAFRVYTPYGRVWRSLPKPEEGPRVEAGSLRVPPETAVPSLPLPDLATWGLAPSGARLPEAGERAARARMKAALAGPLRRYGECRDTPAGQTTSRLSQDLRFGLISVRELHRRAAEARDGAGTAAERGSFDKFIGELAWREFYAAVLAEWPEVLEVEFNPQWRGLPWEEADGERFGRWCRGETGFPIVDAGMRELAATGFMHNRVRMIVAMFLTKDLRIDWRHGESWFLRHLVDGEIGSNNGGWQWSAGTGADAAPYFRIQNPWTQTKRHDPEGSYIRSWVPELRHVAAERLGTEPEPGKAVAPGYPKPMVRHGAERDRTLDFFARHKERMAAG